MSNFSDDGEFEYLDEKRKNSASSNNRKGLHPVVQATIVTAIATIVVAVIGAIPVGSSEKPLACLFDSSIVNGRTSQLAIKVNIKEEFLCELLLC